MGYILRVINVKHPSGILLEYKNWLEASKIAFEMLRQGYSVCVTQQNKKVIKGDK